MKMRNYISICKFKIMIHIKFDKITHRYHTKMLLREQFQNKCKVVSGFSEQKVQRAATK